MVKLISTNGVYDSPIPTYYVESSTELTSIPADAPAGTKVICNDYTNGFSAYMKDSSGQFTEITTFVIQI